MRRVYVDTGAFLALIHRRDQAHELMKRHFVRLSDEHAQMTTADPVVAETVARLRYDAGLHAALKFRDVIERAVDSGWLTVRESDGHLRSATLTVMARYAELPLSYADGVGAVIAEETNAEAVVGLDNDFRVMGFALEPQWTHVSGPVVG